MVFSPRENPYVEIAVTLTLGALAYRFAGAFLSALGAPGALWYACKNLLSFIALVILAVIYFKYFSRVFYKHGLSQREEEPEIKEIARSREIGEFKEPQIFKEVKDAHKVSIAIQEAIMTAGLAATKEKTEIMDIMYVEEKFEEKEKEQEKEQAQEKEEIQYKATSEEAPKGPSSVLRLEKAIEFRRPEANKKEKGEFVLLMDDIVDMDVGG